MAVRQPDALHRHASLLDGADDAVHVAARVDHHGLLAGIVPQQGAVLLERRDRNDRPAQCPHQ
jgi:hypothetical protein